MAGRATIHDEDGTSTELEAITNTLAGFGDQSAGTAWNSGASITAPVITSWLYAFTFRITDDLGTECVSTEECADLARVGAIDGF